MTSSLPILLLGASIGAASGAIGAFMLIRRMTLVGDSLTHVALPGIGIALLLGLHPFVGGLTFLVAAVLGIFILQHRTRIYSEALVGFFFTLSLALGIIITEEQELFEALFGDITRLSTTSALAGTAIALGIFFLIRALTPSLLLTTIAPDLAHAQGIHRQRIELLFLLSIALTVALGITLVGTLLMSSLVIIPAIAAKNIGRSFRLFTTLSAIGGTITAVAGILLTTALPTIPPGAAVVLVGALLFLVTIPFRQHA